MKFLFIVQGEGRGHLTQAQSLSQLLAKNGHSLVAVCVGKSKQRSIPSFFTSKINAPLHLFESPNFVTDKQHKKVKLFSTVLFNFGKLKTFYRSLQQIHQVVESTNPDVILNFYDVLGGVYNFLYNPKSKFWVIGHQYLIQHPSFQFPQGHFFAKFLFKLNTSVTSLGAKKKIALSFRAYTPQSSKDLHVFPPLLREEIKKISTTEENFFLAYMVNPGYAQEIIHFAKENKSLQIEAFWDQKEAPIKYQPLPNLVFHQLSDTLFLEKMGQCKGLVCTAGFESVCEAMYLKKPVMMIPVEGHYEQLCNALDAVQSGAGITSAYYDFATMHHFVETGYAATSAMQHWVSAFEQQFLRLLQEAYEDSINECSWKEALT